MKKLKPKSTAIHNQDNFNEIVGLLIEADMLLRLNMNENGIHDMNDQDEEYLFGEDSICGELLDREDFEDTKNEERLIERLIMHVIVPEIAKRHHEEHHDNKSNRTGINDFFEDLGYEDNKYDLLSIKQEYGITKGTVQRGYDKDLFKERGKPTCVGLYMWRTRPNKTIK